MQRFKLNASASFVIRHHLRFLNVHERIVKQDLRTVFHFVTTLIAGVIRNILKEALFVIAIVGRLHHEQRSIHNRGVQRCRSKVSVMSPVYRMVVSGLSVKGGHRMARDKSPIVKQSRREGYALHRKAHKVMARKSGIPGQHAGARQGKPSLYLTQLREKQKGCARGDDGGQLLGVQARPSLDRKSVV